MFPRERLFAWEHGVLVENAGSSYVRSKLRNHGDPSACGARTSNQLGHVDAHVDGIEPGVPDLVVVDRRREKVSGQELAGYLRLTPLRPEVVGDPAVSAVGNV